MKFGGRAGGRGAPGGNGLPQPLLQLLQRNAYQRPDHASWPLPAEIERLVGLLIFEPLLRMDRSLALPRM